MPLSFYFFLVNLTRYEFDWETTFKSGDFVFNIPTNKGALLRNGSFSNSGQTYNSIIIQSTTTGIFRRKALVHEKICSYQFLSFIQLDGYLKKPYKNWLNPDAKFIQFFKKWIYLDWGGLAFEELYSLDSYNKFRHETLFDREAGFYSYKFK